jgi:hypothetical protein
MVFDGFPQRHFNFSTRAVRKRAAPARAAHPHLLISRRGHDFGVTAAWCRGSVDARSRRRAQQPKSPVNLARAMAVAGLRIDVEDTPHMTLVPDQHVIEDAGREVPKPAYSVRC